MKRVMIGVGLLLVAGGAQASSQVRPLFDVNARGIESQVKAAVEKMEANCEYSMFSRTGPRPAEVARCNRAEEKAISYGTPAARMALARLDSGHVDYSATYRLYDLVARVGDLELVEPLVRGLERLEKPAYSERADESHAIVRTLSTLTYAKLDSKQPAAAWRVWADAHKGKTRAELLDERVAAARVEAATPTFTAAIAAARFLAQQPATRQEGRVALESLLRRELTPSERRQVESAIKQVPTAPAQLAASGEPRA
jgi:hypothetical protein